MAPAAPGRRYAAARFPKRSKRKTLGASSFFLIRPKKWNKRLHPMNEAVVRSFVAELLNIKIMGHYSELVADNKTPEEMVLKAS